jgi:hypothetical protein
MLWIVIVRLVAADRPRQVLGVSAVKTIDFHTHLIPCLSLRALRAFAVKNNLVNHIAAFLHVTLGSSR